MAELAGATEAIRPRLTVSLIRKQLLRKALTALSDVADTCGKRPVPKSLLLRFTLAYTYVEAGADPKKKWLWDEFWRCATGQRCGDGPGQYLDDYIRGTGARSALSGICREAGYSPDHEFLTHLRDLGKAAQEVD